MGVREATHENFTSQRETRRGSDRAFGLVFAVIFGLAAVAPLREGGAARLDLLGIGGLWLVLALLMPRALAPLNRLWFRFGLLLHKLVSPAVMGLLFFAVITPAALIIRWLGRDPLRLAFDPKTSSYWIERRPPGPAPDTMRNQF
jgi:saxitoxin biosynthesis operon SxtJ-like protein